MKYPERSQELTSLCLHYVLFLRSIAFWGHIMILWLLTHFLDQPFPYFSVGSVVVLLGFFTLASWLWMRNKKSISDHFVFIQLMADIFTLSLLLYLTGGSSNPFVSLFMLPVTFASAMLRVRYIWITAITAMICYTLLMFFYQPMPLWQHHGQGFTLHVWGMWGGFLLSAGLVAYFVARIGSTIKARDRALAEAREKALESEKLVALGTLAAGTAHELGTPLATIAILARELEKSTQEKNPAISKKLTLLRSQVDRCKTILSKMTSSTGQSPADSGAGITVDRYLEKTLQEWSKIRPEVSAESHFSGTDPAPRIIADRTVTQAILNVLDNAADASRDSIKVEGKWDNNCLVLFVHDQGEGISDELIERVGEEPFLTTKPPGKGLGLGLYLTRTTLIRLGGEIHFENRDNGKGLTVQIKLPLAQLKIDE